MKPWCYQAMITSWLDSTPAHAYSSLCLYLQHLPCAYAHTALQHFVGFQVPVSTWPERELGTMEAQTSFRPLHLGKVPSPYLMKENATAKWFTHGLQDRYFMIAKMCVSIQPLPHLYGGVACAAIFWIEILYIHTIPTTESVAARCKRYRGAACTVDFVDQEA